MREYITMIMPNFCMLQTATRNLTPTRTAAWKVGASPRPGPSPILFSEGKGGRGGIPYVVPHSRCYDTVTVTDIWDFSRRQLQERSFSNMCCILRLITVLVIHDCAQSKPNI